MTNRLLALAIETPRIERDKRIPRREPGLQSLREEAERELRPSQPPAQHSYVHLRERAEAPQPTQKDSLRDLLHRLRPSFPYPESHAVLDQFAELPCGWDGLTARAPDRSLLERVRAQLLLVAAIARVNGVELTEPWVALALDGSLGIEWAHESRHLAVTLSHDGQMEIDAWDSQGDVAAGRVGRLGLVAVAMWLVIGGPLVADGLLRR